MSPREIYLHTFWSSFLVIIDKLAGGDGCYSKLLDGTSSIYDEEHLTIKCHPSWVTIIWSKGYECLALGHYMSSDGTRMKLWVPLHHMTCYLRWGGAGLQGTHVVCHDVACPCRHCLSPGCLRWGDPCDNAQDRVARRAYLSTVLARGGQGAARTSEASPLMRCSIGVPASNAVAEEAASSSCARSSLSNLLG